MNNWEGLEPRRLFAAGDLDTAFGVNGEVETENPGDLTFLVAAEFLADGKVLIAGQTFHSLLAERDQYLFKRFNADGAPDSTFGDQGILLGNFTDLETDDSAIDDIVLAGDGTIWAVGSGGDDSDSQFLARFNPDGSLDTSFGDGDGSVPIAEATLGQRGGQQIWLQPDGKILLSNAQARLTRFLPDGTIDPSFGGGDGMIDQVLDLDYAITFQDQKILIGGSANDTNGRSQFALARLNADGSLDTTFGDGGKVITPIAGGGAPGNPSSEINAITFLPDGSGRFLAAAEIGPIDLNAGGLAVLRYSADGMLDTTYGDSGAELVSLGTVTSVVALNIDVDGNALVTGTTAHGVAAARLTPDGQFDPSFGRFISFGADNSATTTGRSALNAAIQSDGKLLIAGQGHVAHRGVEANSTAMLLRLLTEDSDPSPVTLDLGSHVLSISGTVNSDVIQAADVGDVLYTTRNGFGRAFDAADVQRIDAVAGAGNDLVDLSAVLSVPAAVSGGTGVDRIAGTPKNDTLQGNAGRDFIDGGAGADVISGGAGNDQIRGQGGADHLYGRAGNDYIEGNRSGDHIDGDDGTDTALTDDDDVVAEIETLA